MSLKWAKILLTGLVFVAAGSTIAQDAVKLATTTSTYDTGLLDHILPPFEAATGLEVHVISVGTGKAIRLGENGDVDVILVHARMAEDQFVAAGYGVNRRDVMVNDFVILGPADDPAGIKGMTDASTALNRVASQGLTFVSRGDDSGTHKRERAVWAEAGLRPEKDLPWYLETGQGMGATLRVADEKNGYVLADRGTWLFAGSKLRLRLLVEGDDSLMNPYGVIAVSPYRHSHVNYDGAMRLIAWLTSPECQEIIGNFKVTGSALFKANAAPAHR